MKQTILSIILLFLPMMASADDSGKCGSNLVWTYKQATHTLTISGTGKMDDWAASEYDFPWSSYREEIQTVIISLGVTNIGSWAFQDHKVLSSITIPESVDNIANGAFNGCNSLTSISIPSKVKSVDNITFEDCRSLTLVELPDGLTSIGEYAFAGCSSLVSLNIPQGVTFIDGGAFRGCSSLVSLNIPQGVSFIYRETFRGCSSLVSLNIPQTVTFIEDGAFEGCSSLASMIIPEGVTAISNNVFANCSSLASITIPSSVTSIDESAFFGCVNINSITVGMHYPLNITNKTFPSRANATLYVPFGSKTAYQKAKYWSEFEEIIESNNDSGICGDNLTYNYNPHSYTLTITGNGNMANWDGGNPAPWDLYKMDISRLVIEDGVLSIGNWAFAYCPKLASVSIPNSVTSIGVLAFSNCPSLLDLRIPEGVTTIGSEAFSYCPSLSTITIPNSVTSIDGSAFAECSGLTSITIGNSVTSIGDRAFSGCSGLTSVTIPNSVTSIGNEVFKNCDKLTSVHISDIAAWCNIAFSSNPLSYAHHLFLNGEEIKDLVIPNSVTSIGDWAFSDCSGLTSVTIPNSVTSIGDLAFSGCKGLTSVTIGNSVTNIGRSAFSVCTNLTSVTIPNSVTNIGRSAFSGCQCLTSLTIPDAVTSIAEMTFSGCENLNSVTIPDNLESIGDAAFYGCRGLTTVIIPNSVTNIGESAFSGCSSLTSVSIPENLKIINSKTFYGCSSLSWITIPAFVEYIYQEAFAFCSSLVQIVAQPTHPPFLFDNSFSNFSVPVKVQKGHKEAYLTAQGWKNFTTINDADKYNNIYIVDGEEYKIVEVEFGSIVNPIPDPTKEGYTFSGWSKYPEKMISKDVEIQGSFTVNKYKVNYIIEGEEYSTVEVEYGSNINPIAGPIKEGYTFLGWSEIPDVMPAHDLDVTGTFTINSYKLYYYVDGELYKTLDIEYASPITPEADPEKEGFAFRGWIGIPETMPAYDVWVYGYFDELSLGKCATPTISYAYGELKFYSETEDATFIYTISDNDIKTGSGNEVLLDVTYQISVYATKPGYDNSDVATATLCWIETEPWTEGITNSVNNVRARPVLIQTNGNSLSISGIEKGTSINIFDTSGKIVGSATAALENTNISTSLRPGDIGLVKIGEKTIKIIMK